MHHRRTFLGAIGIAALTCGFLSTAAQAAEKPNLIYIMADASVIDSTTKTALFQRTSVDVRSQSFQQIEIVQRRSFSV